MNKVIIREDFEGFDVHKRFEVLVDILYTEDNFELGAKLNSIVGQYGISDSDAFIDSINHVFNAILVELDFEELNEEKKFNFIFSGLEYYNTKKLNFARNYEEEQEEDNHFDEIESVEGKYINHNISIEEDISTILENNISLKKVVDENDYTPAEFSVPIDPLELAKFNTLIETYEDDFVDEEFFDDENEDVEQNVRTHQDEDEDDDDDDGVSVKISSSSSDDDDDDDDDDTVTFFVPMILVCYRKEKRADFFIFNPFYKKTFVNLWKLNTLSYFAILNNYKNFFFNLKNFYNIKKYMLHIESFNKQFLSLKFSNYISDSTQIPLNSKVFESYYDFDFNTMFLLRSKEKRRRRSFRSYFLRKRNKISSFLKSFRWFSYEILFKFFMFKYVFFDIKIDYNELKKKMLTVYSIMKAFKKKFARKYRRRKSFKRMVHRNKIGIKMSFIRQQFFEKKKKRR